MSQGQDVKIDRDVDSLRDTAAEMARRAEAILDKSLRALWERDAELAREVRTDDLDIDRLDLAIDDAVLRILALDAPVAIDLRMVVAIKSAATDLERIGDLARNIASCAKRLARRTELPLPPGLHTLADDSRIALRASIEALGDLDSNKARQVLASDDRIDEQEERLIKEAVDRLSDDPQTTRQEIDVIFVAQHLERVGDHATNIAEEVILAAEAENLKHAGKLGTR